MDDFLRNRIDNRDEILNARSERPFMHGWDELVSLTIGCAYKFSWRPQRANSSACWIRTFSGKRASYPMAHPSACSCSGFTPVELISESNVGVPL